MIPLLGPSAATRLHFYNARSINNRKSKKQSGASTTGRESFGHGEFGGVDHGVDTHAFVAARMAEHVGPPIPSGPASARRWTDCSQERWRQAPIRAGDGHTPVDVSAMRFATPFG